MTPGKSEISNLHIKNAKWVLIIEKEVCIIFLQNLHKLTREGYFQDFS